MLRCNMKRLTSSIILCSFLLFCACESAVEDHGGNTDGTLLVNLDVSVALSDIADALTRADDTGAANDNEKMHKLRVVIVRPNWTVEANELIDLEAAALEYQALKRFPVVGDEKKLIYLFVNEDTEAEAADGSGITRKLVDFPLGNIQVGSPFPANAIESLKISLTNNTERIKGPLPMSEKHLFPVSKEPEQQCRLFVTRAAVKFTFRINNQSTRDITLKGLTIDKMAREEWYMPRATYEVNQGTGQREITAYEVPAGTGYYTYDRKEVAETVQVASKREQTLDPVYLLEGKYTDDTDERNYSMELSVYNGTDKLTRRHYFPNLKSLPRNTHVVVNITYKDADVTCTVDVIPYSDVPLEPGFGL